MHQCLTVVEIQHAIFRQVCLSDSPGKDNATLARLARTCRTFNDASLDVLWEELPSIDYLIQCLSRDLWRIKRLSIGRKIVTFCRAMSLDDWEIFRRYSSRVRSLELSVHEYTSVTLSKDVILALSHPPYNGPLIPCLKTLLFTGSNRDYVPLLPVLFTHTLVDVVLPSFALRSPEIPILFPSTCPSLKSLIIREPNGFVIGPPNTDDQRTLSEMIMGLHSLRSFECLSCTLDVAAVVHLSRLPSSIKLTLNLHPHEIHLEPLRHNLVPPAFASLSSLTLQVDALITLTSLFQVLRFKPRRVSFTVKGIPSPDELHLFFNSLVNACDPVQLAEISLNAIYDHWLDDGQREQLVSLSTFQPLLALPNVEQFNFNAMCNILVDDDAITTLTECWPNLTRLFLNDSTGWGIESQVTHRGLITLISGCTALDDFALEVDFTGIDQPELPETPVPISFGVTSSCRFACFVLSKINNPPTIATFLNDVCPRLIQVSSLTIWWDDRMQGTLEFEGGEEWEEVNELLLKK